MTTESKFEWVAVGGWKRKSSVCVYENPWIKVSHQEVITPANTDGIYGVVHFKNTAVGVLPIDDDNHTYLVRQTRYTMNQYTWEIPEGGCPRDEDTLVAAKRELQEEVGLAAEHWETLGALQLSNSVTDETAVIYLARGLSQVDQALEESEDIEVKRLPLSEAIAMVDRGEITDAISVVALLRMALRS